LKKSFLNEVFSAAPEERALILGVAQAVGAAFNAWVPLLVFNTGTQAPKFHVGFSLVAGLAGLQALGVIALKFLGKKVQSEAETESDEIKETSSA
jgi:MFS transporter, ACS family, pantothenate transporter